jgi:hypothetical protein
MPKRSRRGVRQVECEGARGRPLADDDVEPEVLERRIEDLFDRVVQAMDLVDEEDVARLEAGQDRRHVALALERRAGDAADTDAELLTHDEGERGLAQPGRTDEQDVVERLLPSLRRRERDRQRLLDPRLADELGQIARAQRALYVVVFGLDRWCQKGLAHLTPL